MPNVRGGKGYKKSKSGREKVKFNNVEEINVINGEGFYGKIKKRLGGKPAQFEIVLSNGTTTVGIVRGKLHKKVWVNIGNLVLLNQDLEIVKILKETDKDVKLAHELMNKVENETAIFSSYFNHDVPSDEETEDEDDVELELLVNPNHCVKLRKQCQDEEDEEAEEEDEAAEEDEEEEDEKEENKKEKEFDQKQKFLMKKLGKNPKDINIDDL